MGLGIGHDQAAVAFHRDAARAVELHGAVGAEAIARRRHVGILQGAVLALGSQLQDASARAGADVEVAVAGKRQADRAAQHGAALAV